MLNDIACQQCRIGYANMATMNKIRVWARANNASVEVTRYARDAYEGKIIIRSPWNENGQVARDKAAEFRRLFNVNA